MIVTRYLALAALVSALPLGCAQSLFDASPGDEPGPGRDGAVDRPDARTGGDGGTPDAAPPPTECPAPCAADAYRDFAGEQNAPWRYVEVGPDDPHGTGYRDMTVVDGAPPSWTGAGTPAATIASCSADTQSPPCDGDEDLLALAAAAPRADASFPALLWTAPERASYRLTGSWRMPRLGTQGLPQEVRLVRNSQFDYVARQQTFTPVDDLGFDVTLDALEGDAIALSAPGGAPGALGVRFYISRQPGPGSCRTAIDFAGAGPFANRCGSGTFTDATPATEAEAPPPGIPGSARRFVAGSALAYTGEPNDYSQDWTVQFWAMLESDGAGDQWLLSDLDCASKGGIGVRYGGAELQIAILHRDADVTDCLASGLPGMGIPAPPREEWHFFRVARDAEDGVVRVCVDGALKTAALVPSEMTTTKPLTLGRRDSLPAQFVGRLADLRVFTRALPCTGG